MMAGHWVALQSGIWDFPIVRHITNDMKENFKLPAPVI